MPEDMYCAEQICIPPSFPYLLRQYAKAAIRTQPSDLLKWSTAYFRCLSLNVPPPVKPRLEYPIPRDFKGITPGWLKTLLYQLQNNLTIPFKILWDRWIGACLEHHTLIQLLCLGGFEDAQAIPWLKFVAICAGTLTDDLTHTMILICEILTEEPEGGSAMIPLETFVDLYRFLAKIDASNGQTLRNYYFRDSLLSLWREKVEKEEEKEEVREELIVEVEESELVKTSSESMDEGEKEEDVDKVVSCPSLPEDDHYSLEYLLKQEPEIGEGEDEGEIEIEVEGESENQVQEPANDELIALTDGSEPELEEKESVKSEPVVLETDDTAEVKDIKSENKIEEHEENETKSAEDVDVKEPEQEIETVAVTEAPKVEEEAEAPVDTEIKPYESVDTITDQPVRDLNQVFEDDATLQEDLERLRALQQELAGETDEEIEKFKCRLIEEMPLSQSQQEGIKHFQVQKSGISQQLSDEDEQSKLIRVEDTLKSSEVTTESSESQIQDEKDKIPYDDVYVDAIRGIGGTVSDQIINAVIDYMKTCAKNQHGMVMPRNIRHYNCPPLEVVDY